jgi:hypothetical protein
MRALGGSRDCGRERSGVQRFLGCWAGATEFVAKRASLSQKRPIGLPHRSPSKSSIRKNLGLLHPRRV